MDAKIFGHPRNLASDGLGINPTPYKELLTNFYFN
jgi:hypothetical protein